MARRKQNQSIKNDFFGDIQSDLGLPPDLVCRSLFVQEEQTVQCVYLESMVNKKTIDEYILKSFTENTFSEVEAPRSAENGFLREFPFSDPYEQLREKSSLLRYLL